MCLIFHLSFDSDKSGTISTDELQKAFGTFGYRLYVSFFDELFYGNCELSFFFRSPNFCQLCTRVFDRGDHNTMKFDDFIQCCVMLRSLTESFKRLDTDQDGVIDVSYEQVKCGC